tara:strand:- start:4616 stop:6589 length:1974 start_codon:yes stop_codon:yes gene_type:complete
MSYYDIIKNVDLYGNVLNKSISDFGNQGNMLSDVDDQTIYGRTTATTGPSLFTGSSSRNIFSNIPESTPGPMDAYKDQDGNLIKPDMMMRGLSGLQGLSTGQLLSKYGSNLSGGAAGLMGKQYIADAAGNISLLSKGATIPAGSTAVAGPSIGGGVGIGLAIKGMTNDNNPFTYSSAEKFGDYAGNLALAHGLSPLLAGTGLAAPATGIGATIGMHPLIALGSLFLSHIFGKKKKKKAKKLIKQHVDYVEGVQDEDYQARTEQVEGARDEYISDLSQAQYDERQGMYDNQYGGAYSSPYTTRADEGMKFTPKEYKKISKAGRNGDTQLAHINPQEAQMLKAMGGSGTINPYTGLREYGWFSNLVSSIGDIFSSAGNTVMDIASPALNMGFNAVTSVTDPVFDAAGDVIDPIAGGALDITGGVIEGGLDATKGIVSTVSDDIIRPVLGGANDIVSSLIDMVLGKEENVPPTQIDKSKLALLKQASEKGQGAHPLQVAQLRETGSPSGLDKQDMANLLSQEFRGDLENPFIRENVMQMNKGGKLDVVAEFTGNELIVNDQSKVEDALAKNDFEKAAAPIRRAMDINMITPGKENHQGNPMPVDSKGNIYAKGGALPFKVKKGAGIYDHATDQFKSNMTDKQIAMTAKKNIAKWKSNGMA